jgi:hypothetical protein
MALLGLRLLRSDGGKAGPVTARQSFLAVTLSMATLGVGFLMVLVVRGASLTSSRTGVAPPPRARRGGAGRRRR